MSDTALRPVVAQRAWQRLRDTLPPPIVLALVFLVGLLVPALLLRFPMVLVLGGLIGLVVLALVVAFPFLGLLLFLALLYGRPEDSYPALASARLTLLVSLVVMFSWTINAFQCRERFLLHLPVVLCFYGFFVVAVASTALSGSGTLGNEAIEMVKLLVMYLLIVHLVSTDSRLKAALRSLVLFTGCLGARTIWQYRNGEAMDYQGEMRALGTGIFGDPNDVALAMAMALPLALGTVLGNASLWSRVWNLGAVGVLTWTIFITNSRGGMLALATSVYLLLGRRLGRAGMILGVLAVVGLFTFGPSRMSQMSSQEESAQGRVMAWEAGMEMLRAGPVWGVGKGQFTEHHWLTAHNSLVLCLAELGLLGTACWIGLFYFPFRDGRRVAVLRADKEPGPEAGRRRTRIVLTPSALLHSSLVTFMVGGFFLSRTYTAPLYVYLGLMVAAVGVEARDEAPAISQALGRDWAKLVGMAVVGVVLVQLLIRLWS